MAWQRGPLPEDTWGFGGVVSREMPPGSFDFAEFRGGYVLAIDENLRVIPAADVVWYDNSMHAPPEEGEPIVPDPTLLHVVTVTVPVPDGPHDVTFSLAGVGDIGTARVWVTGGKLVLTQSMRAVAVEAPKEDEP
jgi:hypothetical protein